MNEVLKWETQKRKVSELIPYEYNPRSLSKEKEQKLNESIDKFNLVEIPVINLDNTLIAGHQRVTVLLLKERGEELIDVRVPNRQLTEEELKEYNVRSNISLGDWVDDILKDNFSDFDLASFGLDIDKELEEMIEEEQEQAVFEQKFNDIPDKPKYPIVARYNEKYSAVIIVAKNITDLTFLQTALNLNKEASYKSERVGQTHVIDTKKFQEQWEKK
ncbi:hypothetical protein SAMN04489761_3055 [Tenacibaculum sp. MAR_2009_124]|uniref:hypothetical protein n=1 Tax=Tenacibaculum sp. MAR_2009_124 TaxID=1250059 RepID=UPI0008992A1D|nr:hypothetical protein [Tenacibaculum sp. MAR_2009_124]SEC46037.1 hypothetical protein SAMN04489761_3055 [Tenacibaculum sp. MAR_2009_124]